MLTAAAERTVAAERGIDARVVTVRQLNGAGCTRSQIKARLAARRWQRIGRAVVLHNGELTREQRWAVAVIHCGPRAVLAFFTAAQMLGLRRWERDGIHVLVPAGVTPPRVPGIPVVIHRTSAIRPDEVHAARRCQRIGPALVDAAGTMPTARPAAALLAAGVQQRLVTAASLRASLERRVRLRHRSALLAAVDDIAMGAQSLSEIDFVRLCRRYGLPEPTLQRIRHDASGRRRYLDCEWVLANGVRLTVEVDGAFHLELEIWADDCLRQNDIVIDGSTVLRYPAFIVRTNEVLVAEQLRTAFARLGADQRS